MELRAQPGLGLALVLSLLALGSQSCSPGGGGGGGGVGGLGGSGSFGITACSLGCAGSGSGGSQFSCGVSGVFVNQEIRITFSRPVAPSSINNNTFQLVESLTGKTPPGTFSVDSNDSSVLVYRPLLTFNSSGAPIFGLTADATYLLKIPGSDLDQVGSYVTDVNGVPNRTRLQCTLVASLGIFDAKAGAPQAKVFVDTIERDAMGNPIAINRDELANGAEDVVRTTRVKIIFDDVMNPATLANPVTNESNTITVSVDPDGDTANAGDQIKLDGEYTLTIDQTNSQTTVVFIANGGLPSAGSDLVKRKIVVNLSSLIADLGGNLLVGTRAVLFTTEVIEFSTLTLSENFVTSTAEDTIRSGSPWESSALGTGPGGGSGRLGDLVVLAGTTVTLNTESEDFSAQEFSLPGVFEMRNVVDVGDPTTFEVRDGVFEFARVLIESGATLRLEGANSGRIFVRGEAVIQGTIDVSGADAIAQKPLLKDGGAGGEPGPGGGVGGKGGLLPDGRNFTGVGGKTNPLLPGPDDPLNPDDYKPFLNGQPGAGVTFPSTNMPAGTTAFGEGGLAWPQPGSAPAPFDLLHFPADVFDLSAFPFDEMASCMITAPSSPGGGGGHALAGLTASTTFFETVQIVPPPLPPDAEGGPVDDLMIDDTVKTLAPEQGLLRGGGGGGGGGASLYLTSTNGNVTGLPGTDTNCLTPSTEGGIVSINAFRGASAAGGGGGGGGVQVQGGRRVVLNGRIIGFGGDGGAGFNPNNDGGSQAGGGGAGGAILLQGPRIQIQTIPARIDVRGGRGGKGTQGDTRGTAFSEGGLGSPGFARIESSDPPPDFDIEKTKVVPNEKGLDSLYGAVPEDILTASEWKPLDVTSGPTTGSGAQSCWIQPSGNFFELGFEDDTTDLGWDAQLLMPEFKNPDGTYRPQSYRGENERTGPGGASFETIYGSDLGSAPVIVRFQGARVIGRLSAPCSVALTGVDSPVLPGSLTDWVKHPLELSDFHQQPSLTPNVFRFVVIWDRSHPLTSEIDGIDEVALRVTPD